MTSQVTQGEISGGWSTAFVFKVLLDYGVHSDLQRPEIIDMIHPWMEVIDAQNCRSLLALCQTVVSTDACNSMKWPDV